jgi:ribosomal protein S18 acetylase RimI-like enzyme
MASRATPDPWGDTLTSLDLVRAIEERSFNAWPALEVAVVEGWLLRFAEGYSKRANSANALAPTAPLEGLLPLVEVLYRRHGITPCVRITPLAGEADATLLDRLGWTTVDESLVLVAPLAGFDGAARPGLSLSHTATQAWIDGYAQASRRTDLKRDVLARMLAAIRPEVVFATATENDRPVGFGMAVVERGMVGLFDIATDPAARGRGHARRLVSTLMGWGRSRGAMQAYLQVTVGNTVARGLYGSLGYRDSYLYNYWLPPQRPSTQ